jgi:uncharacterized OB-fold protein
LTTAPSRPAPVAGELTRPFWDAATRETLVRQVCGSCGRSFFTPRLACPHCLSEDWAWTESAGRGTLYSFTVCHRAPEPGFEVPYVLAIVDLEEGWSMLANVVDCDPALLHGGLPVDVTWLRLEGGATLPAFRPRDA